MKRIFCFLVLILCLSCSSSRHQSQDETTSQNEMLCGGWSSSREATPEEIELFLDTTSSLKMELKVLSVMTQVVAGLNYCFLAQGGESYYFVKIFRPLPGQGQPQLVSVEERK